MYRLSAIKQYYNKELISLITYQENSRSVSRNHIIHAFRLTESLLLNKNKRRTWIKDSFLNKIQIIQVSYHII